MLNQYILDFLLQTLQKHVWINKEDSFGWINQWNDSNNLVKYSRIKSKEEDNLKHHPTNGRKDSRKIMDYRE